MRCVKRFEGNPILSAEKVPYPATLTYNAGVAKYGGRYVMVFRNDVGTTPGGKWPDYIELGLAFSDDGLEWKVSPEPWIRWRDEEVNAVYDPRLTVVNGECYICFAMDTNHGIRGGIAVTSDFKGWRVLSLSVPDNRNMVLFPERRDGMLMRLERPFPVYGKSGREQFDIWFSESPDGIFWGNSRLVLGVENVPWCNAKIGPATPPVYTPHGWLALFHAVSIDEERELPSWHGGWHKEYTAGVMLLDPNEPWKVKGISKEPILIPEEPYEKEGYRGHVVFPGGMIVEPDGEVKIYYGAADTVECLALTTLEYLLELCQ